MARGQLIMEALLVLSLIKIPNWQAEVCNKTQKQLKKIDERKKFVEKHVSHQKYLKTHYSFGKK